MPIIETDNQARQGPKGRPVFMVLIGSLVLLGLYMVGMTMWAGSESPNNPSQNASREAITGSPKGQSNTASSANTKDVPTANPAYPAPATRSANPAADRDAQSTGSVQTPIPQNR